MLIGRPMVLANGFRMILTREGARDLLTRKLAWRLAQAAKDATKDHAA